MTLTETTLQVWADVRCPWCWMGHRRLARAIAQSGASVQVQHRSFLLEPQGPTSERRLVGDVAIAEWGLTEAEWAIRRDRIERSGQVDGLRIRIDTARTIDSRGAHRVLKLVEARGLDVDAAWEAMFAVHLERNLDLEDWDQLADLGAGLGLDHQEVLGLANSEDYAAEVLTDHREAQSRGFHSVPTVAHGERHLSGARNTTELTAFVRSAATVVE
ncbi:DsbA family oxidoreductase [Phytoactinopolyspora endophytica]|uniref:DsbA family oxidoreductase n=1 Tax=Phytoactinopolyspora endophytica TaxID=1642495 RepID=UPI00101BE1AF|nr:DsbA family protein [Phytoactinopolyspora endophytica]